MAKGVAPFAEKYDGIMTLWQVGFCDRIIRRVGKLNNLGSNHIQMLRLHERELDLHTIATR